jgi:carboxypeptidase family protein/TonB-dependent receptor-like protein
MQIFRFRPAGQGALRFWTALCLCLLFAGGARVHAVAGGAVTGVVTTQGGTVRLAGALVTLRAGDRVIGTQTADGDGRVSFPDVPDGSFQVVASLDGFTAITRPVVVTAGKPVEFALDLPVAGVTENVVVVAPTTVVPNTGTLSGGDAVNGKDIDQLTSGGGFQSALRLLASVIEVPGGVSIKGGRPSQASVQIGPTTLVDPSTGLTHVSLPDDAIDSVAVMPNPYAVEFGRFSSGLVVIQTRRAGDRWKTRLNNLDPAFRTKRGGNPFDVKGISYFGPRVEVGGPIIRDRLFLEQTAQFNYSTADVPSRPENEIRTDRWFSTFTRVDANLSPRHTLMATGGIFPRQTTLADLGTFTPPDATADLHSHVNHGAVNERALWTDTLFSETTVQVHRYTNDVIPHGSAPMQLFPETTLGNFFNRQRRETSTYQWIETVSGSRDTWGGLHLYKFGVDLLRSQYDGSSDSRPVLIRRSDPPGTLARRLDFGGPTTQSVDSTDVALFLQDRIQPTTRWYAELGGRIDRDGIIGRFNATPRIGTAVLLNESGSSVLRGGFGLFFERTPSTAGTFNEFENFVDTRFAADGVTPIGAPTRFTHTIAPVLDTPRSRTWDIALDHRVNAMWALHFGVIDRRGTHELIVTPLVQAGAGELLLESVGRSTYREAEASVHVMYDHGVDLNVSYVRSAARGDLNSLNTYFDAMMWPIIGQNANAPANADVPNRLLARGRAMPTERWLVIGIFDWRSGTPYSVVDQNLDFVGPRNVGHRFPAYKRVELGLEHRFKILGRQPWIGVRAFNAFNSFLPTDVQANITSPAFGTFYNSEYRQFRVQVRFER